MTKGERLPQPAGQVTEIECLLLRISETGNDKKQWEAIESMHGAFQIQTPSCAS